MIIRTYACNDCDAVFEVTCESMDAAEPDCPVCSKVLEWRPARVNIGGSNEAKAVDLTQSILENDYGLSNYKDNSREGDVGYIDPLVKTTSEKDAIMQRESEAGREVLERMKTVSPQHRPHVDNFFGGQSVKIGANPVSAQQLIQAGKSGPGAGIDAMAALHNLGKAGKLPDNYRVVGRAKLG